MSTANSASATDSKAYLGIDTSNYTTSLALVRGGEVVRNLKLSLSVAQGERGLRQSDALFSHVKNLPQIFAELGEIRDLAAVGYSSRPRNIDGSYMPCFLAGEAVASAIAGVCGVPLLAHSHQEGHVAAAVYSAGRTELSNEEFIAFHISGGTTEVLHVGLGLAITKIGGTTDTSAGQMIDRIGVSIGLPFPCGPHMERLAASASRKSFAGITVSVKPTEGGVDCSLSGLENKARLLLDNGENVAEVAAFTIFHICKTLDLMCAALSEKYRRLPILFSGGVASCTPIRTHLSHKYGALFAAPEYSSDNAAGIALLTKERQRV